MVMGGRVQRLSWFIEVINSAAAWAEAAVISTYLMSSRPEMRVFIASRGVRQDPRLL